MNTDMKDKVAVVTGGSSGIGLASAAAFLRDGAKVAICGRSQERLDEAASELASISGAENVLAVACDVLNEADVESLRDRVVETFGRCDTLVCNAGQARASNFYNTSDDDWRDEFELKFFSLLRPVRAFEGLLAASGAGAIVVTSALLARSPEPFLIATGATRAGQLNLMKSLSVEFAPKGIRVNAVLIGLVDSGQWSRRYASGENINGSPIPADLSLDDWFAQLAKERKIPLGRLGKPDEAASAILFFGSNAASFITGETLDLTGGQARNV
jgi:NAD(P)-dependent dehydrogenase (short-subunit alcohol dehydrogenase family)